MKLETWNSPDDLYRARDDEVSDHRPLFTGDIVEPVPIGGIQTTGAAMIVTHPCAMRGRNAELVEDILVAKVAPHNTARAHRWADGFYDRMPLPDLRGTDTFEAAFFGRMGPAVRNEIESATRIACLSPLGVNILQQRLTCHLTRADIPTGTFWEAFAHTYEEADLLEEWTEDLAGTGASADLASEFELWIRADNRQDQLRDPQRVASVRLALRATIRERIEAAQNPQAVDNGRVRDTPTTERPA